MRARLCSLVTATSLSILALAGTATAATAPTGSTDGHRHRRRRRHRRDARDPGGDRHASPRRQRRRRGGHLRRGARRHRAVLVRNRRWRLPAAPDRRRHGHLDRPPRDRSGGDARRLVLGERDAAPLHAGPLQRSLRRRPRHGRRLGQRARPLRDDLARGRVAARDPDRARGLRDRQHLLRPDPGERRLLRRRPRLGRALPRPGRDAEGRRHRLPQPGHRARVRADCAPRREGLLPRRDRRRARRDGAEPTGGADREPCVAFGPDDDAGPAHVCGARTSAHEGVVPRARRLRNGPALERRLNRRRGAQHPGGLSARDGDPRAAAAPVPGGVALRVRRPRRVPRRRGLRPTCLCAGCSPTGSPRRVAR